MRIVEEVKGHPNSKVATFRVKGDFLGAFSKIMVLKTAAIVDGKALPGKLLRYSPLAQEIIARFGDATRVDFSVQDKETSISIARKLVEWDEPSTRRAQELIQNYFNGTRAPIFTTALSKDFESLKPFSHEGHPVKKMVVQTFNDQVNPILAKDGGAMELLRVDIKPTGEIQGEVALMGSCNSCQNATTSTLKGAENEIRNVLQKLKELPQLANNEDVKKLHFAGLSIRQMDQLIMQKQQPALL